jgi:hypothetical protein
MIARQLPARHGLLWLVAGWTLLRRQPRQMFLLAGGYYLLLLILIRLLPVIGALLLPLVFPALMAMLGNGARAIEGNRKLTLELLSEGLPAAKLSLLRLGGLHFAGSLVLLLVSIALGNDVRFDDGLTPEETQELLGDLSLLLLAATPLLMAFWFAPLLALWNGVPATKALFFSFIACWRNGRAFAVYGLAVVVVGIVLPGLLLVIAGAVSQTLFGILAFAARLALVLVLGPILIVSAYVSWRDVFGTPLPDAPETLPPVADTPPANE